MTDTYGLPIMRDVLASQVRNRLISIGQTENRPISSNDVTQAETNMLGNALGPMFLNYPFTPTGEYVKSTKPAARGRKIRLYKVQTIS